MSMAAFSIAGLPSPGMMRAPSNRTVCAWTGCRMNTAATAAINPASALRTITLLRLDVELANETGEELVLAPDMGREGGPALGIRIQRLGGELAFDLRRLERPAEGADQLRDRLLRRPRRRGQPEPDLGIEVLEALLRDRRQVRQRLDPPRRRRPQRAQRARAQLPADLDVVLQRSGHVLAHQCIDGGRAARERHEGEIDVGQPLEPLNGDVLGRVRADARDRQLAWSGAGGGEKIRQRAIGRGAVDDDELRRVHQIAHWLEARQRIETDLPQDRVDQHAGGADQQRVAVGCGPRHRPWPQDPARPPRRPRPDWPGPWAGARIYEDGGHAAD